MTGWIWNAESTVMTATLPSAENLGAAGSASRVHCRSLRTRRGGFEQDIVKPYLYEPTFPSPAARPACTALDRRDRLLAWDLLLRGRSPMLEGLGISAVVLWRTWRDYRRDPDNS